MNPLALSPCQQTFLPLTAPQTPKRKQEFTPDETFSVIKKQRNNDGIVPLPLTREGTLQYKTKHQILHQYNDRTHDVVLSTNDPNEINFYAPRADKAGDNFAGLIDATDEDLTALIRTIRAEIGPENQRKLIAFNFAIISEDEHYKPQRDTTLFQKERERSQNQINDTNTELLAPQTYKATAIKSHEPCINTRAPTPNPPVLEAPTTVNEGIISHTTDVAGITPTPVLPITPLIKQELTMPEPTTSLPHQPPSRAATQPQSQALVQAQEDNDLRNRASSVATTTTSADQRRNIGLPSLYCENKTSTGLLCQLLQRQWPPFNFNFNGGDLGNTCDFSALGCLVTVSRNVLRRLYLHDEPSRTIEGTWELGASLKGQKRKVWEYMWLDMNFNTPAMRSLFKSRTTELVKKLKGSMEHDQEVDNIPFTFKNLANSSVGLSKLWDTIDGLRLFRAGFLRTPGGQWKSVPVEWYGLSSVVEYDSEKLAINSDETSLEATVNAQFQFKRGTGKFAPPDDVEPELNIRASCAFPAAIRVHYTSTDANPDPRDSSTPDDTDNNINNNNNDDNTTTPNKNSDWLRDGPGKNLRGFTIHQERWGVKVAQLPRRKQEYRLMAVVRMRNTPEEADLVRIYSDVGECILPMMGPDLVYWSGSWSLSEPNREFMLYYTPCAYDARYPPLGFDVFPEGCENTAN